MCPHSHIIAESGIGIDVVNRFVLMIVVVAFVVSKSPDALVEVVIFLDFDFMYVYLEATFVPEKKTKTKLLLTRKNCLKLLENPHL